MTIPRRLVVTATALGWLLAGAAAAQEERAPTSERRDKRADARGGLDLVRVALGRSRDGRLRGEITLAKEWATEDLRAAGPGSALCLRLYTARDPEADPPDYLVCATAPKDGDTLVARVLRDRANGLPRPVADAAATRPTGRTLYLRFSRTAVGKPASIRFSAESTSHASRCPEPVGCRDTAPDAPATGSLALRSMARSE